MARILRLAARLPCPEAAPGGDVATGVRGTAGKVRCVRYAPIGDGGWEVEGGGGYEEEEWLA